MSKEAHDAVRYNAYLAKKPQSRNDQVRDFNLGHAHGTRDIKDKDNAMGLDPLSSAAYISGYNHGASGKPHPGPGAVI